MKFRPAQTRNIGTIMWLFQDARKWHSEMRVSQWPEFEADRIMEDIALGRLMLLERDEVVAGAVTITEDDPLIWTDDIPAIYVHRLVVARHMKGQDLGRAMVDFVERRAVELSKTCLRLDCWANNARLKMYYGRLGFSHVGDVTIGTIPSLPKHYQNSTTTLFERKCTYRSDDISRLNSVTAC